MADIARESQSIVEIVSLQNGSAQLTQSVVEAITGLGITCNNPPNGAINVPYSHTFLAGAGVPPYSFSITAGDFPPGLALAAATGVASGIPITAGGFTFTVTVTDAQTITASVQCSISILAAQANAIIITFFGWKLYPISPCADAVEGPEVPSVERAV